MKILIYTPSFYPVVGGLETVNYLIAEGLSRYFDITVVTPVLEDDSEREYHFKMVRSRSTWQLMREYMKCDIFVHSVLSLKGILPVLVFPKRWVAIHHTCYFRMWDKGDTVVSRLKKLFSRFSHNVCVSDAVGRNLGFKSYDVIHNAYDTSLFEDYGKAQREGFVFVGRLVTEKGVDLLLEAYGKYLVRSARKEKLYVVGDGPMMDLCKKQVRECGIEDYVMFVGILKGRHLVQELNRRRCMIVPSVTKEAFGIVALEGLAAGCMVIGSDGDGIEEAIGDCGLLFEKGNSDSLCMRMIQTDGMKYTDKEKVKRHLRSFTPEYMVNKYVEYFKKWDQK